MLLVAEYDLCGTRMVQDRKICNISVTVYLVWHECNFKCITVKPMKSSVHFLFMYNFLTPILCRHLQYWVEMAK
jgi:hypothetical protein